MRNKHLILLSLVPLSEAKALFYKSDIRVSWYFFSDNKRHLCNVIEDYSNIIIIGVIFYFIVFDKIDKITKNICLFLFILNALDLIHLGLMDMQIFILLKLALTYIIYRFWLKLKAF